jgi:hypothetical protein
MTAVRPRLRAVQREYADYPGARNRAVMEFYEANDVHER